jgi:hypothetical protein
VSLISVPHYDHATLTPIHSIDLGFPCSRARTIS